MRRGARAIVPLLVAAVGGMGTLPASAGAPAIHTATLGSTTGTPSASLCGAGDCTYVPFAAAATPELRVPFDGFVTSFSVNSGTCGATVELRVLRPAGGGRYTAVATSPAYRLNLGPNSIVVALPVQAGDVLGLDNDSAALLFDTANPAASTAYYQQSALATGATAAPSQTASGLRLLMSAVVQASPATSSTAPLALRSVRQSHAVWRRTSTPASSGKKAPIGTTFSFTLSKPATVKLTFTKQLPGGKHRIGGVRSVAGHAGSNTVFFAGNISRTKTLPPGHYTLVITARSGGGETARARPLSFTIVA